MSVEHQSIKISVVIPTLNEQDNIYRLLTALQSQDLPPMEIIVVDGGSLDKTVPIVRSFKNAKLFNTLACVADQRNFGGNQALGELIVFMDSDVYPAPDFLRQSIFDFTQKKLQLAVPRTYPYKSTIFIKFVYVFFNLLFLIFQYFQASGGGMCLFVDKKLFMQTNGFSSNYKFEDIEFIRRASRLGKFRVLNTSIGVSDRRFLKEGILFLFIKYILLGILFSLGLFKVTNKFSYKFNHYKS